MFVSEQMQAILDKNARVELCPSGTGASAGDTWCPTRSSPEGSCYGYVGTGGDENTACDGFGAFARAYMEGASTDTHKASCAVITAAMAHESGFSPRSKR